MTYTLTYDYENHLTAVSGGSISASFVYDADGNRVKGTVNGTTTVYIAGLYEYQGGATTLYYEGNALRRTGYATNNGVFYLLQDQLKSSSTLANQNGTVNSRNYFYPFGGNRGGAAFSPLTTKRFTGQYHESGLPGGEGLSYYGARWYDAQLGRFTGPDTVIPAQGNPQNFNRYAYVLNNPINHVDPTGHCPDPDEYVGCETEAGGPAGAGGGATTSGFGGGGQGSGGGWFSGLGQWLGNWWSGLTRPSVDMSVYKLQPSPGKQWSDLYTWERGGLTVEEGGRMASYAEKNNATVLYRPRSYVAVLGESLGIPNKAKGEDTAFKAFGIGMGSTTPKQWWNFRNWTGLRVSDTDINAIAIDRRISDAETSRNIGRLIGQGDVTGSSNVQHGCNFWGICEGIPRATWERQARPVFALSPDGTVTYWSDGITALNYYAPNWPEQLSGPR